MTTTTNHADLINAQKTITVRWHEGENLEAENVEMSLREFKGLLAELREEAERDGLGSPHEHVPSAYLKCAFLAGGVSFRIDVTAHPDSIRLEYAWVY